MIEPIEVADNLLRVIGLALFAGAVFLALVYVLARPAELLASVKETLPELALRRRWRIGQPPQTAPRRLCIDIEPEHEERWTCQIIRDLSGEQAVRTTVFSCTGTFTKSTLIAVVPSTDISPAADILVQDAIGPDWQKLRCLPDAPEGSRVMVQSQDHGAHIAAGFRPFLKEWRQKHPDLHDFPILIVRPGSLMLRMNSALTDPAEIEVFVDLALGFVRALRHAERVRENNTRWRKTSVAD